MGFDLALVSSLYSEHLCIFSLYVALYIDIFFFLNFGLTSSSLPFIELCKWDWTWLTNHCFSAMTLFVGSSDPQNRPRNDFYDVSSETLSLAIPIGYARLYA